MATKVEEALRALAIARVNEERAASAAARLKAVVENTPEWKAYQEAQASAGVASATVAMMDAQMRDTLLEYFQETGDKKPTPGASIQIHTRLRYDPIAAIEWCKVNAPKLVETKLARNFDKVAEQMGAPVEVIAEPRVVLATNLNGYLPKEIMDEFIAESRAEEA